jgi:hypothetical protein
MGSLHIYLIGRVAVADLGEICTVDNESGSGGSAAYICLLRLLPDSTDTVEKVA